MLPTGWVSATGGRASMTPSATASATKNVHTVAIFTTIASYLRPVSPRLLQQCLVDALCRDGAGVDLDADGVVDRVGDDAAHPDVRVLAGRLGAEGTRGDLGGQKD